MTVSLCKHSFSILQPHGLFNPSDCVHCGLTYANWERQLLRLLRQKRRRAAISATVAGSGTPELNR